MKQELCSALSLRLVCSNIITKLTYTPEYIFISSSAAIQIKYFTHALAFWIRPDWQRQRNFVYCRWWLCKLIKLTQKRNVMYGVAPFQLQLADSIIRSDINSIKWYPELFKLPLKCSNMQSRYWDMLMLMRNTFVNKKSRKRLLLFPLNVWEDWGHFTVLLWSVSSKECLEEAGNRFIILIIFIVSTLQY